MFATQGLTWEQRILSAASRLPFYFQDGSALLLRTQHRLPRIVVFNDVQLGRTSTAASHDCQSSALSGMPPSYINTVTSYVRAQLGLYFTCDIAYLCVSKTTTWYSARSAVPKRPDFTPWGKLTRKLHVDAILLIQPYVKICSYSQTVKDSCSRALL